jgi:hypothetical protein
MWQIDLDFEELAPFKDKSLRKGKQGGGIILGVELLNIIISPLPHNTNSKLCNMHTQAKELFFFLWVYTQDKDKKGK